MGELKQSYLAAWLSSINRKPRKTMMINAKRKLLKCSINIFDPRGIYGALGWVDRPCIR